MCFIIDIYHPDKMIAQEDIECYKVLNDDMSSVYQNFKYKYNKLYRDKRNANLETEESYIGNYFICKGYHSYDSEFEAGISTEYGSDFKRIIVKCIIPKGSEYYHNHYHGEYVSNSIKIVSIINKNY